MKAHEKEQETNRRPDHGCSREIRSRWIDGGPKWPHHSMNQPNWSWIREIKPLLLWKNAWRPKQNWPSRMRSSQSECKHSRTKITCSVHKSRLLNGSHSIQEGGKLITRLFVNSGDTSRKSFRDHQAFQQWGSLQGAWGQESVSRDTSQAWILGSLTGRNESRWEWVGAKRKMLVSREPFELPFSMGSLTQSLYDARFPAEFREMKSTHHEACR